MLNFFVVCDRVWKTRTFTQLSKVFKPMQKQRLAAQSKSGFPAPVAISNRFAHPSVLALYGRWLSQYLYQSSFRYHAGAQRHRILTPGVGVQCQCRRLRSIIVSSLIILPLASRENVYLWLGINFCKFNRVAN